MATIHKKTGDVLTDWLQTLAILFFYGFIPFLPLKTSYAIARTLSHASLKFLKKQRNTILGNMDVAFGTKMSEDEKMVVAREAVTNMLKSYFETFYMASRFRKKIDDTVSLEGREHLGQALARGKGAIALSAHFGNFTILGAVMAREKYPFYTVIKEPKRKHVAKLFGKIRDLMGHKWIPAQPRGVCLKNMLTCLRNNQIVCLITDEHKRRGGVNVDFFGHNSPTAAGPAVLSLRTGAAIVPVFIIRQKDDTHKVIIESALKFNPTGNQEEDIRRVTRMFTERIEFYIKSYPNQWFWLNRRWKGLSKGDKHYRG